MNPINFVIAGLAGLFAGGSVCTLSVYPALLNRMTASKEDPKWVTVFFTLGLAGVYFLVYALFGALTSLILQNYGAGASLWSAHWSHGLWLGLPCAAG